MLLIFYRRHSAYRSILVETDTRLQTRESIVDCCGCRRIIAHRVTFARKKKLSCPTTATKLSSSFEIEMSTLVNRLNSFEAGLASEPMSRIARHVFIHSLTANAIHNQRLRCAEKESKIHSVGNRRSRTSNRAGLTSFSPGSVSAVLDVSLSLFSPSSTILIILHR